MNGARSALAGDAPAAPRSGVDSPPLVLAIEAATHLGSAAVLCGGRVLAAESVAMRDPESERLMPAVAAVLAAAGATPRAIDRIVCGGGPGSFTGLRIAAAIAKGLATATGAPLVAVPSLALAAARPGSGRQTGGWLVVLDAMRGERYVAVVDLAPDARVAGLAAGARVVGYAYLGVTPAEAIPALVEAHGAVGVVDANAEPPLAAAAASFALGSDTHSRAGSLVGEGDALVPAAVDLALWEPDYGRKAEAQVKWEALHGRHLSAGAGGVGG